ncbi:MAG: hypothetical protein ABID54_08735 [Pseudomonadota bacterium]
MKEIPNTCIEFETGKQPEAQEQAGVTFKYISRYFSTDKRAEAPRNQESYFSNKLRYRRDPNGRLDKLRTVTIIGVSGAMGSEILKRMLTEEVLPACEKIQLFRRPETASQGKDKNFYYALIEKLKDGMGGVLPHVELIDSYSRVDGELLIMCAGKTISKDASRASDRTTLRHENKAIFENCARSIKENPFQPPELVIVVSNPNELSTSIFSKYFKRVVAIGPVLDSLRFQREIRDELSLSAEISIDGLVGGNHELRGMVLYKSLLRIDGERPPAQVLGKVYPPVNEYLDSGKVYERAYEMLQRGDEGVFKYINSHPIAIRVAVKPLIEYYCGGKADFPLGVAATSTIKAFQDNTCTIVTLTKRTRIGESEVCIGVPLFISKNGVEEIELDSIDNFREYKDDEQLLEAVKIFRTEYSSDS